MIQIMKKSWFAWAFLALLGMALLPACGGEESTESPKASSTDEEPLKALDEAAESMMGEMDEMDEVDAETLTFSIKGMTCEHCMDTVTKALIACPGVDSAEVDLEKNEAIVIGARLDEKVLAQAVKEVGYEATIKN